MESRRTTIPIILLRLSRVDAMCGEIMSLFLIVVRFNLHLSRRWYYWGQLACRHKCLRMLPLDGLSASSAAFRGHLSVVCASSRDGQATVTPTLITYIFSSRSLLLICGINPPALVVLTTSLNEGLSSNSFISIIIGATSASLSQTEPRHASFHQKRP